MSAHLGRCAGCSQNIRWAYTPAGKRMPLDPDPVPAGPGTFVLEGPRCRPSEPLLDPPGTEHYMSHFATCPDAALFRKSPAGMKGHRS